MGVPRGEEVQEEEPGTAFLDGNAAYGSQPSLPGEGRVSWFVANTAVPLMEDVPPPGCVSIESTRHTISIVHFPSPPTGNFSCFLEKETKHNQSTAHQHGSFQQGPLPRGAAVNTDVNQPFLGS